MNCSGAKIIGQPVVRVNFKFRVKFRVRNPKFRVSIQKSGGASGGVKKLRASVLFGVRSQSPRSIMRSF